jgi:P27 family predicted phage terminase small subunit
MPAGMDALAQKVWRRVIREMAGTGVIVAADTDVLRAYCEAVSSYSRNVVALAESGPLVRGARGKELIANPLHRLVRDDRDAIRVLARELGLSPSARSGLHIDGGDTASAGDIDDEIGLPGRLAIVK